MGHPFVFKSPRSAVAWAEGYLLMPVSRSQFEGIVKGSVEHPSVAPLDANGERITGSRLTDLAHTISVALSGCQQPGAGLYRHIWGKCPHTFTIAEILVRRAWTPGARGRRTIDQARLLAVLQIENLRLNERHGKRIPVNAIARQMGVTRDCYYDNWAAIATVMREQMDVWMEQTENQLFEYFEREGII